MIVENFGGNVGFDATVLRPRNHQEVVGLLAEHRGRTIRAAGALHSWSSVCEGDVIVDLEAINQMELEPDDHGRMCVRVGGGRRINDVLQYLEQHGYILPSFGVIGTQTIAGAMATATHGSGRSSMAHYVARVELAGYDPKTGDARIFELASGTRLRAARCAVGYAGIVLTVWIPVEPMYLVSEECRWCTHLREVLPLAREHPRLQFYLVPGSWRWFVQLRKQVPAYVDQVPSLLAPLRRLAQLVLMDVLFNGAIRTITRTKPSPRLLGWLWRRVFTGLTRTAVSYTGRPRDVLMMCHDLYAHLEVELFVPEQHIEEAATFVEWILRRNGRKVGPVPEPLRKNKPFYVHLVPRLEQELPGLPPFVCDYLVTIRRVLPDDTLISMTSGRLAHSWYAISLITYQADTAPFVEVVGFLARWLARAFHARPHWGKHAPLDDLTLAWLYPKLPVFQTVCRQTDPDGVFVNQFGREFMGM